MLGGRMGKERGGRLLPVHPAQGGSSTRGEQQLQQQAEERFEPAARWKRQQVQLEPERDLCRRSGGKGRLYRRRRQSPRLPGPVWQVDCCWTCHLGCWMRQRCARSLCQSGRWTVVGLVTWGVGCASDVPGVYASLAGGLLLDLSPGVLDAPAMCPEFMPVWQVDCCWTCHLGCWMRQRCAR